MAIPWRGSQGSLTLPIDREASIPIGPRTMPTGIRSDDEGKWLARKHDGAKRHPWRKIQIGVDDQTLKLRAIEGGLAIAHDPKEPVDGSHVGDALVLPEPSNQLPADGEIGSVTANGPSDTRTCRDAVAERGADALREGAGAEPHGARFRSPDRRKRRAERLAPARPVTEKWARERLGPGFASFARHNLNG